MSLARLCLHPNAPKPREEEVLGISHLLSLAEVIQAPSVGGLVEDHLFRLCLDRVPQITVPEFNLHAVESARYEIEKHRVPASKLLVHVCDLPRLIAFWLPGATVDPNTPQYVYGLQIIPDAAVPPNTAYVLAHPEYLGGITPRDDIYARRYSLWMRAKSAVRVSFSRP